ncbi:MAG: cell division protein DivIC [Maribacter sp.]|jgi:cell division protein DivIC
MAKKKKIDPLKPLLDKLPAWIKNIYILTLIVFFFIIIFINRINPFTQWSLQSTKQELQDKKKYYEDKLGKVKSDKIDNDNNVEKFARENYYMKKQDEDVFIIVEEGEDKEEKK